jgi:LuxR family maltose regulon positive regulatory protein
MTSDASGEAATQLLATKLHAPRRRREVVQRSRLTDSMLLERQPALTLISAPAGFGKTTLLTEWLGNTAAPRRSASWLALDAGDNDPAVFGAYLIAALRLIAPAVSGSADALLQTPQPLTMTVTTLVNDLALLDRDVALVLDDYHVIDSPEVHEAISFLVEHAPSQFHLVLATRADPPLPLARWRARGDLLELRAADLRFTGTEAASYFNDAMEMHLSAAEVGALEARTEGWIAALQLAALSMRGRDDVGDFIDNFTGDDRFVLDYLAEEVLERQPDDVRRFLLHTAVLDRLSGLLCDAVTGGSGGKAVLEMLDRSNLFLVALDDRRLWYRYHHLFADVLRARLVDEEPELVAELHLRASTWYGRSGDMTEAVRHAVAGEHFERAAQLIELATPQMRRTRQEATLRRWLMSIPDELFSARPVLTMGLVGSRMVNGDPRGVGALLDDAERWLDVPAAPDGAGAPIVFDHEGFVTLAAQIAVFRAGVALLSGDLDGTIAHATRVLDLVEPTDHLRRGSATALLALAHWAVGDLEMAERRYTEAVRALIAADHLPDMLGCSLALADIQIAQGRLADATRTFESGLRWTTEHPGLRGAADMHVGLSEVLIERNDLDAAARHLEMSTELGASAGLPQYAYRWRVTMARLRRARGDLDGALDLLDEAAPLYDTDFSPPVRPVAALRARVLLARGDLDAALGWATERGLTAGDELSYIREFEHITFARVLIARHAVEHDARSIDDALTLLHRLLAAAEEGARTGSVVEILVLQSSAHQARHDTPSAVVALEDALRRAEPEGQVRLFLHAGPGVLALLRSTRFAPGAARYAQRVLAASTSNSSDIVTSPRPRLVDELSSRELDVLRLLRSELTGPDIARELHVSLNTLRTHTKNIYTKLGAKNRAEAIRRAAEHGL